MKTSAGTDRTTVVPRATTFSVPRLGASSVCAGVFKSGRALRILEIGPDPEMLYAEALTSPLVDELRSPASPLLREAFRRKHYDELSNAEGARKLVLRQIHSNRGCSAPKYLEKKTKYSLVAPLPSPVEVTLLSASSSSRNAGATARL